MRGIHACLPFGVDTLGLVCAVFPCMSLGSCRLVALVGVLAGLVPRVSRLFWAFLLGCKFLHLVLPADILSRVGSSSRPLWDCFLCSLVWPLFCTALRASCWFLRVSSSLPLQGFWLYFIPYILLGLFRMFSLPVLSVHEFRPFVACGPLGVGVHTAPCGAC